MAKARKNPAAALVDPMSTRLGYQLRRASVLMMAELGAALAPQHLRPAEAAILLLIGANPGCRQGEVGESLGILRANMVALVAGLVEQGLVKRARADGRSHALSLTAKGNARAGMINQLLDRQEAAFQSRLDSRSLANLLESLTRLRG